MAGMSATDILGENGDNGTVATDVVVIGGLAEASIACGYQGFDAERAIAAGGTAVNDQQFDCGMFKLFHRQLCIRKVDTKAVMTVRRKLPSFSALGILKSFIMIL